MKLLTPEQLDSFFETIVKTWELRLPILLPDGTRVIGSLIDGSLALHGGAVSGKPTAAFFPQQSTLFTINDGELEDAPPVPPLFIVGFTPRDLACLRFIDRFFADGLRDDPYFTLRGNAVVAALSGYCGSDDGSLITPACGDCDLEFFWDRSNWLVIAYSETGKKLIEDLPDAGGVETVELLRHNLTCVPDENVTLIRRASVLLRTNQVPDSFWEEIGDRCIACTGCNLACPTCTCFGVQDWRSAKKTERSRMWDSCQLDGFMREAGGHNPLGSEAERTRRRIHHKLAADLNKWGEISCFLCGRCDTVCPTGIGIIAVTREMVARFA